MYLHICLFGLCCHEGHPQPSIFILLNGHSFSQLFFGIRDSLVQQFFGIRNSLAQLSFCSLPQLFFFNGLSFLQLFF